MRYLLLFLLLPLTANAVEIGGGHDIVRGGDTYHVFQDVGDYVVGYSRFRKHLVTVQKRYQYIDLGLGLTENTNFNVKICFSLKIPANKFSVKWLHCSNTGKAEVNYSFDTIMLVYRWR